LPSTQSLRLGIVGCGAIAQLHAEAVLNVPDARLTCLVDKDLSRAEGLRKLLGVSCAVSDGWDHAAGLADAMIVALPHNLHASVTQDLLEKGLHVLCEKPLATSAADAEACTRTAGERRLTLAVGMIRRFHWNTPLMRMVVREGALGTLERFEYVDGFAHAWPSATPFYFRKELAGGGIWTTMGVHILDQLLAWFDDLHVTSYADDNCGGVEADARAELVGVVDGLPIPGTVRCTNLYNLRSHFTLFGSDAAATIDAGDTVSVEIRRTMGGRSAILALRDEAAPKASPADRAYFEAQIRDFVAAVRTGARPTANGDDAVTVLQKIEECYRVRRPLESPWTELAARTEGGAP
jgi:predicted dehydrogenase